MLLFFRCQDGAMQANLNVQYTKVFDQIFQLNAAYRISGFRCQETKMWQRTSRNITTPLFGKYTNGWCLHRSYLLKSLWYWCFLNKKDGSLFSSLTTGLYLTFKLSSMVEKVSIFLIFMHFCIF